MRNLKLIFDGHKIFKMMLQQQLDKSGLDYRLNGFNEIHLIEDLDTFQMEQLKNLLAKYGIEIIIDQKNLKVQQIKEAIQDMLKMEDFNTIKISKYLSSKLNNNYNDLASLFSEYSYCTIENYIIIQKVERIKEMLLDDNITLTEISYQLNYSSIAHLSAQFKKITGLNPTTFRRVLQKRKELDSNRMLASVSII